MGFNRLPSGLANALYPAVRYTSLMRALELRLLQPWVRSVEGWRVAYVGSGHGAVRNSARNTPTLMT
ncbi:hypothetical protein ACFLWA_05715, partial [Chloroflexota bacterium]